MFKTLIFAIYFTIALSKTLVKRDDGCEECLKHIETVLANLLKQKETNDLLKVKGVGTCGQCELSGMENFNRLKDQSSCVGKTESGEITHRMTLQFPNITAQCTCKFGDEPIESFLKVIETAGDPVVSMCTLPHMAKNMKSIHFIPEKFPSDQVHSLEECFPLLADFAVQPLGNFKVGLSFQNTKYSIDLVTKGNGQKNVVENTKMLVDNANGWKHRCEGSEKLVKACQCGLETSYLGFGVLNILKFLVPCALERRVQNDFTEILNELICPL